MIHNHDSLVFRPLEHVIPMLLAGTISAPASPPLSLGMIGVSRDLRPPSSCSPPSSQDATVIEVENVVQTAAGSKGEWGNAAPNQKLAVGARIRTRHHSRATVGLTGLYAIRFDQFTTVEITPGLVDSEKPKLDLFGGAAFIFSRERSGEMDIEMPAVNAALRGTQLFAQVLPGGKSLVQVLEGSVEMKNAKGSLLLESGEAGQAVPGQAPTRTAVIAAVFFQPVEEWPVDSIKTAPEAVAESYHLQSLARLESARAAALRATELAPLNGFAWTRLAELEFSVGQSKAARVAIRKGLELTPDNARAHALHGFILSSENRNRNRGPHGDGPSRFFIERLNSNEPIPDGVIIRTEK